MSAAAGAAAERDWQRVIDFFKDQGALHPSDAVNLPTDYQLSKRVIAEMIEHGDLNDTGGGVYWLDYDRALKRRRQTNRRMGRILTVVSAAAAMAALAVLAIR